MEPFVEKFNYLWNIKCSNYDKIPNILPPVDRIIVIGDIHGDIVKLKQLLRLGKVINNKNEWIGGDTAVVQLGDQIDSCRPSSGELCSNPKTTSKDKANDINILYFLTDLHKKAQQYGGAVYSIMGNHELMNVNGDFSYVSYKNLNDPYFKNKDRYEEFSPGNNIANFLACTRKMALIIGSNLFVHAGILPEIVEKYSVNDLNTLLSLYLFDELQQPHTFKDIFLSPQVSPLWNRVFGNINNNPHDCKRVMKPLKEIYKVGKIYVGHTPQINEGINNYCDNTVWLTDIGASQTFDKYITMKTKNYTLNTQVLEIKNDNDINILF
jgi:hypothetical protein